MTQPGSKHRILVVEDEAIVSADIQDRLGFLGYEIAGATDHAGNAIQLATDLRPDLVLMDIMLKGDCCGIDAANHIRSQLRIPVIYLTASSSAETFAQAQETDPAGYIIKPFEETMLKAAVEIALYKHRIEREREELIAQLQAALNEVKTLTGLIPICAWCKNIRDDHNYWQSVEQYVRSRTSASFTHSICPGCREKYLTDIKRAQDKNRSALKA